MLLWLNFGNIMLTHQATIAKMSNKQSFTFRTIKNNTVVCIYNLNYISDLRFNLKIN